VNKDGVARCHGKTCDKVLDLYKDDVVWACPADLAQDNPNWEPAPDSITEEMRQKAGVFSNCLEDFGGSCPYEPVPICEETYNKGDF
jgi:hypothetical protein